MIKRSRLHFDPASLTGHVEMNFQSDGTGTWERKVSFSFEIPLIFDFLDIVMKYSNIYNVRYIACTID